MSERRKSSRKFTFELYKEWGKEKISMVEMPDVVYALDIDHIYSFCKDLFEKIKTDAKKDNNESAD